jgi:hypothetical protein
MATIAVFGVLAGGGAYAASQITAKDIAKNAVRSKHIKKNAVKTPKIKDGAITEAKLGEEVKGARAYAVIDPSTCTTAPDSCTLLRAKNVVAARRSPNNPTGFYCVPPGPGSTALPTDSWLVSSGRRLSPRQGLQARCRAPIRRRRPHRCARAISPSPRSDRLLARARIWSTTLPSGSPCPSRGYAASLGLGAGRDWSTSTRAARGTR